MDNAERWNNLKCGYTEKKMMKGEWTVHNNNEEVIEIMEKFARETKKGYKTPKSQDKFVKFVANDDLAAKKSLKIQNDEHKKPPNKDA